MIILSIIDLSLVNQQIINPSENSFRQSTMIKSSMKSNFLNSDEVIKFLQKDKSLFRILPLGRLSNNNRWSAFQIESIEAYHPAKL